MLAFALLGAGATWAALRHDHTGCLLPDVTSMAVGGGHRLDVVWAGRPVRGPGAPATEAERLFWRYGLPVLLVLWGGAMGAVWGRVVSGLLTRRPAAG